MRINIFLDRNTQYCKNKMSTLTKFVYYFNRSKLNLYYFSCTYERLVKIIYKKRKIKNNIMSE